MPLRRVCHLNGLRENLQVCLQHLFLIQVIPENEAYLEGFLPLCRYLSNS